MSRRERFLVCALIALLSLMMLGAFAGAGVLWLASGQAVHEYPELSHLRWPVLLLSWGVVACAMIFIALIIALAVMVVRQVIFRARALVLARAMSVVALVGMVLIGTIVLVVPGSPVVLFLLAGAIACLTLALLMEVMRGLLVLASGLRTELDGVI